MDEIRNFARYLQYPKLLDVEKSELDYIRTVETEPLLLFSKEYEDLPMPDVRDEHPKLITKFFSGLVVETQILAGLKTTAPSFVNIADRMVELEKALKESMEQLAAMKSEVNELRMIYSSDF